MDANDIILRGLADECEFSAVRSSGAGGQNVNKVSSQVVLKFNIHDSHLLSDYEKETLYLKLSSKISADGFIMAKAQESRSQLDNRKSALVKLASLIASALTKPKVRVATRPTRSSKERRVFAKKARSLI